MSDRDGAGSDSGATTGNPDRPGTRECGGAALSRRRFLGGASVAAVALAGGAYVTAGGRVSVDPLFRAGYRGTLPGGEADGHWLGPDFWGNRLQDWRREGDRVECLRGEASYELRTSAVLTRELVAADGPGHLRVRTGIAGGSSGGFCGFLIGVGRGDLDPRAAALAQRASGVGGGTICALGADGRVGFREHEDEDRPLSFAPLAADRYGDPRPIAADDAVELALDLLPREDGRYDLRLEAREADSGELVSGAVRRGVSGEALRGGVSLVSSPPTNESGRRFWFEALRTAGPKVAVREDRRLSPVLGTLYSVDADDAVFKLTAQLLPVGPDAGPVRLERRPAARAAGRDGGRREASGSDAATESWREVGRSRIESGYVARFRVEDWPVDRAFEYRVVFGDGRDRRWAYRGWVPRNPEPPEGLDVALFSCTKAVARSLETGPARREIDGDLVGRYTPANVFFPHAELVENVGARDPDLLVFVGDQIYEDNPTRVESRTDPGLDFLYKWYLWLWAFRDLTRDRPTIVLVDDHDVYQPNVWGERGDRAPPGDVEAGGYVGDAAFVNRVQRVQCGHDPDPADDRPVGRGIETYFGSFAYGGVRFAMLEDRKFKVPPPDHVEPGDPPALLGDRQTAFLREWAAAEDARPAVCLSQTALACALTTPEGDPLRDYDANGYPKPGRDRAVRLLRKAGALVLSGDQHLGTLVRHGLAAHTDGVVQFTGPASGATYVRWFEPVRELPGGTGHPHTGLFTDAFGNRLRTLAVANPEVSFRTYRRHRETGQTVFDRDLRSDGYGLVRVDHGGEAFRIECWPWDADPTGDEGGQYPGWPYRLPFDATDGE